MPVNILHMRTAFLSYFVSSAFNAAIIFFLWKQYRRAGFDGACFQGRYGAYSGGGMRRSSDKAHQERSAYGSCSSYTSKTAKSAKEKIAVRVYPDFRDIIPSFMENTRKDVEAIARALLENNRKIICRLSHSMKDHGKWYDFDYISRAGKVIETAAANEDFAGIEKTFGFAGLSQAGGCIL